MREVAPDRGAGRIEALGVNGRVVWYDLAVLQAALGKTLEACQALDRAVDEHAMFLGWTRLDPRLDALRGQPCFASVESRIYGAVPTANQ